MLLAQTDGRKEDNRGHEPLHLIQALEYINYKQLIVARAVKSCQKTHPGNRSRQHRLTMYT